MRYINSFTCLFIGLLILSCSPKQTQPIMDDASSAADMAKQQVVQEQVKEPMAAASETIPANPVKKAKTKAMTGDPIPTDDRLRQGQLANGIKYYIQKNSKPENRAELRLAINAGSILEDEDQLGLAHFVEHMAFNGTENFEKSELVDYLESVGTRFGLSLIHI